ncbi:MAG: hypothetical protein HYR85_26570 [Planctomycetes bacterium]|nr:hypothetical protein [Planctomycetota bacterium]MBI3843002.1 hypothetical protein [Planctomycetota bacterium]
MSGPPARASRLSCLAERQLVLEGLLTLYHRLVVTGEGSSTAALEHAERCLAASYERLRGVQAQLAAWTRTEEGGASSSEAIFEAEATKLWKEIVVLHGKLEAAVRAERDDVARVLRRLREARRIAKQYRLPGRDPGSIVDASS